MSQEQICAAGADVRRRSRCAPQEQICAAGADMVVSRGQAPASWSPSRSHVVFLHDPGPKFPEGADGAFLIKKNIYIFIQQPSFVRACADVKMHARAQVAQGRQGVTLHCETLLCCCLSLVCWCLVAGVCCWRLVLCMWAGPGVGEPLSESVVHCDVPWGLARSRRCRLICPNGAQEQICAAGADMRRRSRYAP